MPNLPPGRYERLIDHQLRKDLLATEVELELAKIDPAEAPGALVQFLSPRIQRALAAVGEKNVEKQWDLCNQIMQLLEGDKSADASDLLDPAQQSLLAVARSQEGLAEAADFPPRPQISLSLSELLVNGRGEASVGKVLADEIPSADHVDLLCSFLKWSGFLLIRDSLKELRARGGRLRILTTAYCGATEERVLDALHELGAEVSVSLDTRRTRLHAKAWLLHRNSGYSTAFIGSSNLSAAAMQQGLEWNVRVSAIENPAILQRFAATIESYWEDKEFQSWKDERVRQQFRQVISSERPGDGSVQLLGIDLSPYPFQQEILEKLDAARKVHDRHRNLIVAATGTGKTVVAAFDYARLCRERQAEAPGSARPTLLFVAHREEILKQSRRTFCEVLQDPSFGEYLVGGHKPLEGKYVFASVQSLSRLKVEAIGRENFDVVIVDEFHHAQAATYQAFLNHFQPQELLGLTATPERADGHFVQDTFFAGRITAELRLWDALDRGLLAPFQYFGIADGTDLTNVPWQRSGYQMKALSNVYSGNDVRARLVHQQIQDKVSRPEQMRALGFCVSVEHAEFMAAKFQEWGYRVKAVTGSTPAEVRSGAIQDLKSGVLQIIFAVDIFNEGVDIPSIDTLLLLRPTASATVFQQQLGRGLRFSEGKECLTVLDFIGQANRSYSWASVLCGLTGGSPRQVDSMVADGFPTLPPGCCMQLDRQSKEFVLANIRQATRNAWVGLSKELRQYPREIALEEFLQKAQLDMEDVYEKPGRSWTSLRAHAGFADVPPQEGPWKALARLRGTDDPALLKTGLRLAENPNRLWSPKEKRQLGMLAAILLQSLGEDAPEKLCKFVRADAPFRAELEAFFSALLERVTHIPASLPGLPEVSLQIHCRYTLDQIMAGFDFRSTVREGVRFHQPTGTALLFVTLNKSEKDYSPRTMYRDYAISQELFHWESQNKTRPESSTGQRYLSKRTDKNPVLLFVRHAKAGRGGITEPYFFAGPVTYVSHKGSRPMQITWRLKYPLSGDWYRLAKIAAG
ncbi:MAG: DUF3427 domain-containing protein [Planctomycetota bacterium]